MKQFIENGDTVILVDGYEVKPITDEDLKFAYESDNKDFAKYAINIIDRILGNVIEDPFQPDTFQALEFGGVLILKVGSTGIFIDRCALKIYERIN